MNHWELLSRELDAWQAADRRATLWWRDDDACRDSPALQRLLAIARAQRIPVVIAAVPATADATLAAAIESSSQATIVQHGFAHRNHAAAGERSAELGSHRLLAARIDELGRGRDVLARLFAGRFAPVLVPPWNRIAEDLPARLPAAGFSGLSCFGPRANAWRAPGLLQVNAHVDLIAWRRDRAFIGEETALERLVAQLRARRMGDVDTAEPTGVLTHHLAFGDAAFAFVDALAARTRAHAAVAWLDARSVFGADAARDTRAAATSGRSA